MATEPRKPITLNVLATGRIQVWIGFNPHRIYDSWQHWLHSGVQTYCGRFGEYEVERVTADATFDWGARWYWTGSIVAGEGYATRILRDGPVSRPDSRFAVEFAVSGLGRELQVAGTFNDAVALSEAFCRTWLRWNVEREAA